MSGNRATYDVMKGTTSGQICDNNDYLWHAKLSVKIATIELGDGSQVVGPWCHATSSS